MTERPTKSASDQKDGANPEQNGAIEIPVTDPETGSVRVIVFPKLPPFPPGPGCNSS